MYERKSPLMKSVYSPTYLRISRSRTTGGCGAAEEVGAARALSISTTLSRRRPPGARRRYSWSVWAKAVRTLAMYSTTAWSLRPSSQKLFRAHSKKNAFSRSPEIVFPIASHYTSKRAANETSAHGEKCEEYGPPQPAARRKGGT